MRSDDAVETIKRHAHDEQCAAQAGSEQRSHYQSAVIVLTRVKIHIYNLI